MAGNIGVGKSTFTTMFAQRHSYDTFFEVVDQNPYLADFYADMRRWSFHLQVFFLTKRYSHHLEIQRSGRNTIQDRSIWEDALIFAKNLYLHGNMAETDYHCYQELFHSMVANLALPDLLVYLKADVPTLVQRIGRRGRSFERTIDPKYLEQLNDHYDHWVRAYEGNVLTIDTDGADFVNSTADFAYMAKCIEGALTKPSRQQAALPPIGSFDAVVGMH